MASHRKVTHTKKKLQWKMKKRQQIYRFNISVTSHQFCSHVLAIRRCHPPLLKKRNQQQPKKKNVKWISPKENENNKNYFWLLSSHDFGYFRAVSKKALSFPQYQTTHFMTTEQKEKRKKALSFDCKWFGRHTYKDNWMWAQHTFGSIDVEKKTRQRIM